MLKSIHITVIWFQVFPSNMNNFQLFLSNTYIRVPIIWFSLVWFCFIYIYIYIYIYMKKIESIPNVMNLFIMVKPTLKCFGFIKPSSGLYDRKKKLLLEHIDNAFIIF